MNNSIHCHPIHRPLWKCSNSIQLSKVGKQSAAAISGCRGLSATCFQQFCSQIMHCCDYRQRPTFPHFLLLVECTNVGLPHLVGKLLQVELSVLRTALGFAFTTTHVWQIIAHIIRIVFIVDKVYQKQCEQQVGVICQLSRIGPQNCIVLVKHTSTPPNHRH